MAQEFTRDELLKMLPQLDYSNNNELAGPGGTIDPQKAAKKIRDYVDFLNAPGNENIKNQTQVVEFDSQNLINWLQSQSSLMNLVQVFFAMDEVGPDKKFTVIFWPSRGDGPDLSASPYNIGGRRP